MARARQSYTVNNVGYQGRTSGRVGQTARGRFSGARAGATMVDTNGNKRASYSGRMITRNQRYRDLRKALGMTSG